MITLSLQQIVLVSKYQTEANGYEKLHISKNNKKGYLKIYVAVNIKTKKILSMMKVTDEHIHDSKALSGLVNDAMKSDGITTAVAIGKLFADGSYDNNEIFRYLGNNGILPCIKLRKNSRKRWKEGNILRNFSVLAQRNALQKWKDSMVSQGKRWIVETVFSCIKRRFGEYIYSAKLKNMIQE